MKKPYLLHVIIILVLCLSFLPAIAQDVVQSNIISKFEGLNYGNLYELKNGQIWKQTEYWVWVWYSIDPKVIVYQENGAWKMKVYDIDHPVTVERLK